MNWLTDPKTKEGSVTLTLYVISFAVTIALCIAEAFGAVKTTSSSLEILYSMSAMYLGRRINFKSKNIEMGSQGATTDKESE